MVLAIIQYTLASLQQLHDVMPYHRRIEAVIVPKQFPHVALHANHCCSKNQTLLAPAWLMSMLLPFSLCCKVEVIISILKRLADTTIAEVHKFTRPCQIVNYSYHKHALQ